MRVPKNNLAGSQIFLLKLSIAANHILTEIYVRKKMKILGQNNKARDA